MDDILHLSAKPDRISVGTVLVPCANQPVAQPKYSNVTIKFPSRLDAACTDPGKIYEHFADNIYPAGQINFCVDICKTISVTPRQDNQIICHGLDERQSIIKHAVILMQKALSIENGFDVHITNDLELRHCGLGSSASIIQGIGAAINELYGSSIPTDDLIRYLIANHGEEIDGDDEHLVYVQSVGGSGVCGNYEGGLIIMTGSAVPIVRVNLPEDMKIVFGVPNQYLHPDADTLITKEIQVASEFKKASQDYSREIAYRLLNEAIPELIRGNYTPMKEFIFDYRWDMGSIKNCSYAYPSIVELAEKMRHLRNDPEVDFIALSTAGPGFFIATRNIEKARNIFHSLDMRTYVADIHNDKYKIIKKEQL